MRDTLYISLQEAASDGRVSYGLLRADAGALLEVDRAELEALLDGAAGKRIILLAPAADVRLATIQVPARQPQKVLQAAPFALEDQLADDVDSLHFAIGPRLEDDSHPVAVVAAEKMAQWLEPLSRRNLVPEALIPETLCLPPPDSGQWVGLVHRPDPSGAARVVVRSERYRGLAFALDELGAYLDLADPDAELRLSLLVPDGIDHDFTGIQRQVELLPGHGSGLAAMVHNFKPTATINLLQGEFAQEVGMAADLRPWKAAAMLAGVWIALAVGYEATQAWKVGREASLQEARNLERFQALFPEESGIDESILPMQVQQKLSTIGKGSGRSNWFDSLKVLSEALAANPGLDIRSVQLREGDLFLFLTGTDLQAFEKMRLWFEERRDANISDVQANSGTDGVQVRFRLTTA